MGKIKKIEFKNEQFDVADWASWIAQDCSGTVMAYEHEPVLHEQRCWDIAQDGHRWHLVKSGWRCAPINDWDKTLLNISNEKKQE